MTMITPSYLGETIEYSSLHACRSTLEDPTCNANDSPFIDQCGYDQAGIILQHIYGALNPPNRGQLKGSLKRFDQSIYTKPDEPEALSLGDTGYLFVPEDCQRGESCRIHIAFHGCAQDIGHIGQRFVENTGYNAWADTNHLIVLYPKRGRAPFCRTIRKPAGTGGATSITPTAT